MEEKPSAECVKVLVNPDSPSSQCSAKRQLDCNENEFSTTKRVLNNSQFINTSSSDNENDKNVDFILLKIKSNSNEDSNDEDVRDLI